MQDKVYAHIPDLTAFVRYYRYKIARIDNASRKVESLNLVLVGKFN